MALPSGYTQLGYIESSGSQYVDTGFKHNQNTRVVMDVMPLSQEANAWLFDGRISSSSSAKGVFFYYSSTKKWSADYNDSSGRYGFSDGETDHLLVDYDKNTCTINGVSKTWTAATFQSTVNLCLLACNTAGTISGFAKVKLYSCRIYDNGTLIRDYVPAKRESDNAVGLYDTVNSVFYENAGSGTFAGGDPVGPTGHRAMINGTTFEITGGRSLVNGTVYDIEQGRCMSDGTVYDISFQKPKIVTITGTPNSSYGYATINGTKLSEAGVFEFDGPLTISVLVTNQYGISTGSTTVRRLCRVYLNGTAVSQQENSTADKAYTMTSESEEVTIEFKKNSIYVSGYGTEYYWTAYITTS